MKTFLWSYWLPSNHKKEQIKLVHIGGAILFLKNVVQEPRWMAGCSDVENCMTGRSGLAICEMLE
jgi:hypothetical protein